MINKNKNKFQSPQEKGAGKMKSKKGPLTRRSKTYK